MAMQRGTVGSVFSLVNPSRPPAGPAANVNMSGLSMNPLQRAPSVGSAQPSPQVAAGNRGVPAASPAQRTVGSVGPAATQGPARPAASQYAPSGLPAPVASPHNLANLMGGKEFPALGDNGKGGPDFSMQSDEFPSLGTSHKAIGLSNGDGDFNGASFNGTSGLSMFGAQSASNQAFVQRLPPAPTQPVNHLSQVGVRLASGTPVMGLGPQVQSAQAQSQSHQQLQQQQSQQGIQGMQGMQLMAGVQTAAPSQQPARPPSSAEQKVSGVDRYGLMGLLSVIRMTDPDLNTLALGTDLTALGLNLNSSEVLYATFAYPCSENPSRREPDFVLPYCYYMQPPALKTSHLTKFQLETLFYIFYAMPKDTLQVYAAKELYAREWRYHKQKQLWFARADDEMLKAAGFRGGAPPPLMVFDVNSWSRKLWTTPGPLTFMAPEEITTSAPGPQTPSGMALPQQGGATHT